MPLKGHWQILKENRKNHGYETPKQAARYYTLRFAGLFPITFSYWIVRLTNIRALRFRHLGLTTTYKFQFTYSDL
jgi:hypothetical protein